MRHSHYSIASWFILVVLVLTSSVYAQSESRPPRGMLAWVDGSIKQLNRDEEKQICGQQFCEPNFVYHISDGIHLPAGTDTLDYSRKILKMSEAWSLSEGSNAVTIAVIDTGVDYTHPDLQENMVSHGYNFITGKDDAMDDQGHGTHCAGIAAAELNHLGIAGVAPRARILPVKFMDANGDGDITGAVKAIDYAVAQGANILSLSWGGPGFSQFLADAIARAIKAGVLVVAAAGNESSNNSTLPKYPADFAGVIAVASTDETDLLSPFSNFSADKVLIAAPGSRILSSYLGHLWQVLSGTSMATPQVAGALALGLALRPKLGPDALVEKMCSTAKKSLLTKVKCGRLDVAAFLQSL